MASLIRSRGILSAIIRAPREIVATFRKQRPALVRDATDLLVDTALTRLVSEVVKLKSDDEIDVNQPDFFERALNGIVPIPKTGSGAGRRTRYRMIGTLPLGLVEQMIKHHFEKRRTKRDQFAIYREIVDFVRQHVLSDDVPLNEALVLARAATSGSAIAAFK